MVTQYIYGRYFFCCILRFLSESFQTMTGLYVFWGNFQYLSLSKFPVDCWLIQECLRFPATLSLNTSSSLVNFIRTDKNYAMM